VIALAKIDLSVDPDGARVAVESIALGVDVLPMNALAGGDVAPLLGQGGQGRLPDPPALTARSRRCEVER
jgi:hypothetical protein